MDAAGGPPAAAREPRALTGLFGPALGRREFFADVPGCERAAAWKAALLAFYAATGTALRGWPMACFISTRPSNRAQTR